MDVAVALVIGALAGGMASSVLDVRARLAQLVNVGLGIAGGALGFGAAGAIGMDVAGPPAGWLAGLLSAIVLVGTVRALDGRTTARAEENHG